jgi:hypothetical protein
MIPDPNVGWHENCPKAARTQGGEEVPRLKMALRVDDLTGSKFHLVCAACGTAVSINFPPKTSEYGGT